MRRLVIVVLLTTACCATPVVLESARSSVSGKQGAEHSSDLWRELLTCGEQRTSDCRASIVRVAEHAPHSEPASKLARILLEEWDLQPSHPSLARARKVFVPLPTLEEARALLPTEFESVTIVVSGVITPEGRVKNVTLLRASKYEELNERIAEAFSRARYRPAWGRNGFIFQRVEYLYRLEPRA